MTDEQARHEAAKGFREAIAAGVVRMDFAQPVLNLGESGCWVPLLVFVPDSAPA